MASPYFFQSLTRGIDVGANSYLIQLGKTRIVLDAGVHPKIDGAGTLPDFSQLGYDTVDGVLISHAHLDHIGGLPVLYRQQPNAQVFMTEETLALGDALLHNSVNVMKAQREELGIPEYPLYTHHEADQMRVFWSTQRAGREFRMGESSEVACEFFHAGHVLGAAAIRLRLEGRSILYTGDVHFEDQTICRGADFPSDPVDTLIIEATRGDSERSPEYTRANELSRLANAIRESLDSGGSVLIPVFAMGKTQELILSLHELREAGEIPAKAPIQIGGLSTKMTTIFDRFTDQSRRHHRGFRILKDIENLNLPARRQPVPEFSPGGIFALSSGMMTEKTISNRFAHHILPGERNALLFVGYADPDSPGGRILESERGDRVRLNGNRVPLNCRVEKFDFSGHAPRNHLLDFIGRTRPRQIILVHGDEPARRWMADRLKERLPQTRVTIPHPGERIEI